jgi:hypothetical protein
MTNGAINHDLHETKRLAAGTRVVSTCFCRNQGGESMLQQPLMQPIHFEPPGCRVWQQGKDDVQSVKYNTDRTHLLTLRTQRSQHPTQIESSRLDHIGQGLSVQEKQARVLHFGKLPAKASEVVD